MSCGCDKFKTELAQMQDQYNTLAAQCSFLFGGHPLVDINDVNDIALFDTNGNGTGRWTGWAFADGAIHNGYQTSDFRDRFRVGGGLTYPANSAGGEATHVLTIPEIPVHTHVVTDPGHTHAITDPGHTHTVTDPGHTHAGTVSSHTHGVTLGGGAHIHPLKVKYRIQVDNSGADWNALEADQASNLTTLETGSPANTDSGDHTHTGTSDPTAPGVTVTAAFTGNTNASNTTGITNASDTTGITIADTGGGLAHNNTPMYFSCIVIQKT